MTVYELTEEQMDELKNNLYWEMVDTGEDEEAGYMFYWDIPDELVFDHFSDIVFVEDDFFCSCR